MSGYKVVMGFLAILITMFLWIPLGYVFDLVAVALNSGITDATTISHNNSMVSLFYYSLFFIILVVVIYVIKTEKGEEEAGEIVYMPAAPPQQLSGTPPGPPGSWRITLLLIGILLLVTTAPTASATWWNESYQYKQQINVSVISGSTPANYQVRLVFENSTVLWSNFTWTDECISSTSARIRFTNMSENTLLDHWVEKCDSTNEKMIVYVKVDQPITTDNYTIYMYFGDTDSADSSNGTATFLVFDQFDNSITEQWTEVDPNGHITIDRSTDERLEWYELSRDEDAYVYKAIDMDVTTIREFSINVVTSPIIFAAWSANEVDDGDNVVNGTGMGAGAGRYSPTYRLASTFYTVLPQDDRIWPINTGTTYWVRFYDRPTEGFLEVYTDSDRETLFTSASSNGTANLTYSDRPINMDYFYPLTSRNSGSSSNYTGWIDDMWVRLYNNPEPNISLQTETSNISLILGVSPDPVYNQTGANFSIFYQQFNGLEANITINASSDSPAWNVENISYTSVPDGTTLYFYIDPGNYTKHDNITIYVNATSTDSDYLSQEISRDIQNSPPTAPSITLSPVAVIIGDNMTTSGSSTDGDGESITYWYRFGYDNWTNITDWILSNNLTILEGYEYETILAWVMGDDGEENGTAAYNDMNVTNLDITYPTPGLEIIGKTISFSFNFTTNFWHQCFDNISGTLYNLGYITGNQNTTRTIDYGNQTYEVVCYSLANSSITYSKNVSFYNSYSNWNVSIYTENDWNTPLNITDGNVSIQINCIGGSQFVYNFTGVTLEYITPECDVETITAKVDYPSDSYTRERLPPDCTECEVRMYMIDATEYTVLQIPIYMSDYAYYDSIIEIYKESGGNHYTISEGYFDVERKYITYLTKDNKYLIRIKLGSEIRDIGFLYAATATAQYLSLSEISLRPSVTLISNNIQMYAEFDDITQNQSTLRIRYIDLLNQTEYVKIQVYSGFNTTAWYDSTFYSDNVTVTLNNINTSPRQNVKFTVSHESLGNSPIVYVTAAGTGSGINFGLDSSLSWVYQAIAFFVMIMTIFIIVPEIRIPGYLILIAELGIFSWFGWFTYGYGSIALLLTFLVGGIIYELKYKGVDK